MAERVVEVTVQGLTPGLLMHRLDELAAGSIASGTSSVVQSKNPEEKAERAAYRLPDGELYLPSEHFRGAIIQAATGFKIGKKTATSAFAGSISVEPAALLLGKKKWDDIDARTGVNPATKGRNMIYRPHFNEWEVSFLLKWDDRDIPDASLVRNVLDAAGRKCGVASYRPTKRGPFGRFMVVEWKEKKEKK